MILRLVMAHHSYIHTLSPAAIIQIPACGSDPEVITAFTGTHTHFICAESIRKGISGHPGVQLPSCISGACKHMSVSGEEVPSTPR